VHTRFRTPHIAIVVLSACAFGFSLVGSFQWNVLVSATSRLVYYGSVCAALLVLRRKPDVPEARFQLPAGNLIAVLALLVSLVLVPRLDRRGLIALTALAFCIAANSFWAAKKTRAVSAQVGE
jgi:amino acid transporter